MKQYKQLSETSSFHPDGSCFNKQNQSSIQSPSLALFGFTWKNTPINHQRKTAEGKNWFLSGCCFLVEHSAAIRQRLHTAVLTAGCLCWSAVRAVAQTHAVPPLLQPSWHQVSPKLHMTLSGVSDMETYRKKDAKCMESLNPPKQAQTRAVPHTQTCRSSAIAHNALKPSQWPCHGTASSEAAQSGGDSGGTGP